MRSPSNILKSSAISKMFKSESSWKAEQTFARHSALFAGNAISDGLKIFLALSLVSI